MKVRCFASDAVIEAADEGGGSAAGMCLALAVGRGDSPLARLSGPAPLVDAEDVVLIGQWDAA